MCFRHAGVVLVLPSNVSLGHHVVQSGCVRQPHHCFVLPTRFWWRYVTKVTYVFTDVLLWSIDFKCGGIYPFEQFQSFIELTIHAQRDVEFNLSLVLSGSIDTSVLLMLFWVFAGLAVVGLLSKRYGYQALTVAITLRLVYHIGIGPTLALLGTLNVSLADLLITSFVQRLVLVTSNHEDIFSF